MQQETKQRLERLEAKSHSKCICFYDATKPRPTVGKRDKLYVHRDTGATSVWNGSAYSS